MSMTENKPNHLQKENSPYLIQHAFNPVDWYPWGPDALNNALEQNKLLIISIGYAACHWCHVMEHESFEDADVAEVMNRHFISVKVDREERPDIDHVYMAAAQATTGRGGWPLNVIALPNQQPVFAGTYFSKHDWIYILNYFAELHQSHPQELIHQSAEILTGMKKQLRLPSQDTPGSMESPAQDDIFAVIQDDLDLVNGGIHGAPKFPMPVNMAFLLEHGVSRQNTMALNHLELSLDKMAMGGIYDQLGGGFSRYSVDARWEVPHFEKMLYDNAQLISLYSRAYAVKKKYAWKKVVEESVEFIDRELTSPNGLFYASIDADSDGAEGAFYAWTCEEIRKYLGDNSGLLFEYYSCEERGNWEANLNILRKSSADTVFAEKHGLTDDQLSAFVEVYKNQLLTVRSNRLRPATDDKILTCWNALMISALVEAAKALNKPLWLKKAITAAGFYQAQLAAHNGKLWRNSKGGYFAISGFLDDYCFLIKSFLDIHQATLDEAWLTSAESLTGEVLTHFNAEDRLFFRLTSGEEPGLIQESVELSDNVIPSSNSQMARNLFVLGHLLNKEEYLQRAEKMVKTMVPQIKRNPAFFANWASLLAVFNAGPAVVNIYGDEASLRLQEFSTCYLPHVLFSGTRPEEPSGTDRNHDGNGKTLISVCHGKTCYLPVETVHEAMQLLGKQ